MNEQTKLPTISLRKAAAYLPSIYGDIRHQTIDNRRKKNNDTSDINIEWIYKEHREFERKSLQCIALQKKKIELYHIRIEECGKQPTEKQILQITLQKENDDEQEL